MSRIKLRFIKSIVLSALSACSMALLPVSTPALGNVQHDESYFKGKDTYMYYCARCHGVKANGHGRIAALYMKLGRPRPSNFTSGIYSIRPENYMRSIISEGGGAQGLSEFMPPFMDELSDTQINDVLHFIRTTSRLNTVISKEE